MNSETWGWPGPDCVIIEDNTGIEISKCFSNGLDNLSEDHLSCSINDTTTPIKACGDLAYNVTDDEILGKDIDLYRDPSSQVKRRRMLQFEPEALVSPLFNDDMFLRSKETQDSLEDTISDMSQWAAGFTEDSPSVDEYLDPSAEGWIADCFNDAEMLLSTEDFGCASGDSAVHIDVTEVRNTPLECHTNAVDKLPVRTGRNVVFKGRKSYMCTPPKQASSVVYPFTFIKPCGMHGDVTLKDINQWIHNPPTPKQSEQDDDDPSASYQTSAFSGKPVVGKTKIRTEGGEGSITILRTKG